MMTEFVLDWQALEVNRSFADLQLQISADYNDMGFNLYSFSLDMKLNIPKCQCSFTLQELCVLLEV